MTQEEKINCDYEKDSAKSILTKLNYTIGEQSGTCRRKIYDGDNVYVGSFTSVEIIDHLAAQNLIEKINFPTETTN